jgi:prepilin-type N-terminal cleavage/methylation domain-containing protein
MNNKGFTLIELMMVTLIIGIMSAMVIPRYEQRIELEELNAEKKFTYVIWEGLETHAKYQKVVTGTESWPEHPLHVLGRTRGVVVTFELGIPDQDNEWQFDGTKLYHRRMNNEIWYFDYNASNFTLSELPVKL